MSVFSNVRILKNLEVLGTTTSVNSEQVNIKDRYTYNNSGYTSSDFKQSGIIFNNKVDNPDTNFDPLIVDIIDNRTVRINDPSGGTQSSLIVAGDYVQLSGFTDSSNNGLFVVVAVNTATINTNHYYEVDFYNTDVFGGLHVTALGNVNDPLTGTARIDRVNITYLQTNADGKMSINNCTNANNVTTSDIGGDFIRNGDVGGQQGAGGITEGGLTLKGNNTKDIFELEDGTILEVSLINSNNDSEVVVTANNNNFAPSIGDLVSIVGSSSNDGSYYISGVSSTNNTNDTLIFNGVQLTPESLGNATGTVVISDSSRPSGPPNNMNDGNIQKITNNNTIEVVDIQPLKPGQTIVIDSNIYGDNNGYYYVVSVDTQTNTCVVDGTLDNGNTISGRMEIANNTDTVKLDATGNPTRDNGIAALSIEDSAYDDVLRSNRVGGLKVQGNVLIEPDSKLYTGYLTGARKIDGVIANEADITTVEFLNAHPVQTRASIRKAEVDSSDGANGNVQLPDNLASVYIYKHTDGVKTVTLPAPSTELDGQVTTIILGSALGNSVVVQTTGVDVGFDHDPLTTTATLNLLGEKLTLMCNFILGTWFIL